MILIVFATIRERHAIIVGGVPPYWHSLVWCMPKIIIVLHRAEKGS